MEGNMVMDDNLCPQIITIVDGVENTTVNIDLNTNSANVGKGTESGNGNGTGEVVKKKRGRKKKEDTGDSLKPVPVETVQSVAKKRGRKPKGGKITFKQPELNTKNHSVANIILHLKCSLNDLNEYNTKINKIIKNPLEYNPAIPPTVESYIQNENLQFSCYNDSNTSASNLIMTPNENTDINRVDNVYSFNSTYNTNKLTTENADTNTSAYVCSKCSLTSKENNGTDMKEINMKLKKIKINLYKNSCQDKKSACFWCTYDYDNPECYIPKYDIDGKVYGYGSFCRPECAVAYLMKENIDDSTKFERYHLLNQIYSKVYDYKKNIKPAPNPYFLLEKYYGNLTIQEYRKLLKTEHMLLVIDKPMTRILPELHEDNELFVLGNMNGSNNVSVNNSGVYKVKRQSEKNQTKNKNAIVKDNFGIQ
jgi:hypothetical protein